MTKNGYDKLDFHDAISDLCCSLGRGMAHNTVDPIKAWDPELGALLDQFLALRATINSHISKRNERSQ